jgi:predicted alpha/beta-fold hydrolase
MNYFSPHWLPSGHLQTIYPALCMAKPEVQFRRERWLTPDQDFIDVDFIDGDAGKPFVVLFHGLEGSSDSHYARALMATLRAKGWSGAVPHFRGCSGELNHAPRFYHSGDSQEIGWIIRKLHTTYRAQAPDGKFFACGVSLGGNALLRWLGESQQQAHIVDAACAISAPLDLAAGGASLSSGFNMLYTRMFLRTLKPKCLKKLQQYPQLFDRDSLLQAKTLYEFDNIVTAPLHGYRDTEDYWDRASAKHILADISVPTLVLNAQNDPFLPARHLPSKASPHVKLEYPSHGGHVGFAVGAPPGSLAWLPQRVLHFFEGKQ